MSVYKGISDMSIYDTATGTVVQLSSLIAEGTLFHASQHESDQKDVLGNPYHAGDRFELVGVFIDSGTEYAQLLAWMKTGTEVNAAFIGPSICGSWQEAVQVEVMAVPIGGAAGGRAGYRVRLYCEKSAAIYWGVNILEMVQAWEDTGADNAADGYTFQACTASSFSGGVQTFQNDGAGTQSLRYNLVFPIAGVSLTMSVNYTDDHSDTGQVGMAWHNYADSQISQDVSTITGTGVNTVTATSPSNIYTIRVILFKTTSVTVDTVAVKEPSLRADGSSVYVQY